MKLFELYRLLFEFSADYILHIDLVGDDSGMCTCYKSTMDRLHLGCCFSQYFHQIVDCLHNIVDCSRARETFVLDCYVMLGVLVAEVVGDGGGVMNLKS